MSDVFMNTYHRLPVTFASGGGCYLFDVNGKRYLDFSSGIAVNCLGHRHPALLAALDAQAKKLFHVSNYYQCDTAEAFARKLTAAARMKKVFLCNSGAEANECACKIARKYSLVKYGEGRHTIVTLKGSFHGRTITTLSATGQDRLHKDFGPFTAGFRFIEGGNIEELKTTLDSSVCALFMEAVQGESGVIPQSAEFIAAAAEICAKKDILLMFDEIQCGLGRTGNFFAFEHYGVKADVVTLAKGLAGGLPVGAALAGEKTCDVLGVGDHGSTFGANPLAAACGTAVLDVVDNAAFLSGIAEKGAYFKQKLEALKPKITAVRGRGLILAADLNVDAWPVLEKLLDNGLLALTAGGPRTLRFLPPYIISNDQIDEGLDILNSVLKS
ncbi:MAG: acetylornithine/succinylornithine family transaminase [Spirochaetaceae bacterium]|jgi:acetylornithine/N-succinyldiaminopimelate aminotransferase|nr:acetylornithine/succinylornithine family transaminase [Spirochaetaceae bacterium]